MYQAFRDRADIYVVYIAEAHAENEWQMESNEEAGICIRQHTTFAERMAAARLCAERLGLTIPTLVDAMDNAASERFAAWPERIYIIGTDGRIAYRGGPGPSEFNPTEATAALRGLLNA
ncbi:MAG: hypothetical protein HZB53_03235 [Chloroflexi bacterium]|nr:hypothetical protein [Chloroflexota bacterium]